MTTGVPPGRASASVKTRPIRGSTPTPSVTPGLQGLPAAYTPGAAYTLIAYTLENDGRANNSLTVGTTKFITTAVDGLEFNGTFIRALNTNPAAGSRDVGNYVQFDGVTADGNGRLLLTDVWDGGTDGVGIAGVQLQGPAPVPEPASVVLFGLGTLALIVWRCGGPRKR